MSSPFTPYVPVVWYNENDPGRPSQPSDPYLNAEYYNTRENLIRDLVDRTNLLYQSKRIDQCEKFIAKTENKNGVAVLAVFGDSTSAIAARWARRLLTNLAADNVDVPVGYYLWNDGTQALATKEIVQAGLVPVSPGVKTLDNFNRTAADLKGSTADSGQVWGGSSGGTGNYSLDGTKAVRSGVTGGSPVTIDSGVAGDRTITLTNVIMSTVGTGTSQSFRIYTKYLNSTNTIYGYITVGTTGSVSWGIAKTIAGVATTMLAGPVNPIAASTAGQTFNMILTLVGTTVTFVIGSQTITAELAPEDVTTLASATVEGIFNGPFNSLTIDSFSVNVTSVAGASGSPLSIDMYNGSFTGTTLAYQTARLAAMCPVIPDLIFINSCHNYGSDTPSQYLTKLDTFINLLMTTFPGAGIAVMSQNGQKSPAAGISTHLARCQALSSYCAVKGIGYVPVIEAFRSKADLGASLVGVDGVHPTSNTDVADAASGAVATNGAQLWTRVVYNYLASRRKAIAPTSP